MDGSKVRQTDQSGAAVTARMRARWQCQSKGGRSGWRDRGEFSKTQDRNKEDLIPKACGDMGISSMTQVSGLGQWECWGHCPGWSYRWSLAAELAAQRGTQPFGTHPLHSLGSPPALSCPGICWCSRLFLHGYFYFSCFHMMWSHALPVRSEPAEKEHCKWLLKCFSGHL